MKKINLVMIIFGIIFLGSLSFILSIGMFKKIPNSKSRNGKLQITTSFYPLYYFASEIGGEKATVKNLTPSGTEPHDYEPSTQDIALMENSAILIMNGAHLESWGDKIKDTLQGKNVLIVTIAEELATAGVYDGDKVVKDPHVWLNPILAKKEVEIILQALIKTNPENKVYYAANAKKLAEKLDLLDQDFRLGLQNCKQKNIVTSHAAFGYIASQYNLQQVPISGLSPDEEPSPRQLAAVAQVAKANHVSYIFFETLISPRLSQTLGDEIGAKTLVFNPLEGLTQEEQSAGKNYFSIQKENLENLKIALECT